MTRERSVRSVAVLAVVAVLLLWARPAAAHTELTASTPGPGAVVAPATAEVALTFSGRVQGDFSTVAVTGPDGADHARGTVSLRAGQVVQAVDGPLPPGSWQIAYRVLAADGHPVTGTVAFTVAPAAAPSPSAVPRPSGIPSPPAAPSPSGIPSAPAPTASPTPTGAPDLRPAADESPVPRALAPTAAVLALAAAAAAVLVRRSRRS